MRFCQLTDAGTEKPVYVNPDHVVAIRVHDGLNEVWTVATYQGGQSLILFVEEGPVKAIELLERAASGD